MRPGVGHADGEQDRLDLAGVLVGVRQGGGVEDAVSLLEPFAGGIVEIEEDGTAQHHEELLAGVSAVVAVACAGGEGEADGLDAAVHVAYEEAGFDAATEALQLGAFAGADDLGEAAARFAGEHVVEGEVVDLDEALQFGGADVRLAVLEHGEERAREAREGGDLGEGLSSGVAYGSEALSKVRVGHFWASPEGAWWPRHRTAVQ